MPTINIKKETYERLQSLMAAELQKRLQKETIKSLVKHKFGITFDEIINQLISQRH